jgi:hypothetical protein
MAYSATVLEVLIASPGDVIDERQAARETIRDWNRKFSKRTHIVLQPRMWELDARPQVGSDPQELINRQFVRDCDLAACAQAIFLEYFQPERDLKNLFEVVARGRSSVESKCTFDATGENSPSSPLEMK